MGYCHVHNNTVMEYVMINNQFLPINECDQIKAEYSLEWDGDKLKQIWVILIFNI